MNRRILIAKALDYIFADKAIPVDLHIALTTAGVNVDALEERHNYDPFKRVKQSIDDKE